MPARLSPEQQFLADCIRGAFGQLRPADTGVAWMDQIDWGLAADSAFRHDLAPVVHAGLVALERPAPEAVRRRLSVGARLAALRTQARLEPALRSALSALEAVGLEPIVLKGAALAYVAYPEPAYRTLTDIDLLLPEHQVDAAQEALVARGFWTPDGWDATYAQGCQHLAPLFTSDGQISVELHHDLFAEHSPFAVELPAVRARSEPHALAGVPARTLGAADALLHVCVHLSAAHEYRWFPLRALVDILAITSHWPTALDWELFLDGVRRAGARGAVYWPLCLGRAWLGAPVPEAVLSRLAPPAPIRGVISAVMEPRYVLDNQEPQERGSRALWKSLLLLSIQGGRPSAEQLVLALRILFPRAADVGAAAQPWRSGLGYATYVLNPARVARGLLAVARLVVRWAGGSGLRHRPAAAAAPRPDLDR